MLRKGSWEIGIIAVIMLIVLFLIVSAVILISIKKSYFEPYGKDFACSISARGNALLIEAFRVPIDIFNKPSALPATPPLACSSQFVSLKGNEEEVILGIVKLMGRCWDMLGTITYPDLVKSWGITVNTYNTCFNFNIDLDKGDSIDVRKLFVALNKPMDILFDNKKFPGISLIEYVEATGMFGNKLRVDERMLIQDFVFDKESVECKMRSCMYYIRFYDGATIDNPDGLILSNDASYNGKKGYIQPSMLSSFVGVGEKNVKNA